MKRRFFLKTIAGAVAVAAAMPAVLLRAAPLPVPPLLPHSRSGYFRIHGLPCHVTNDGTVTRMSYDPFDPWGVEENQGKPVEYKVVGKAKILTLDEHLSYHDAITGWDVGARAS